MGRTPRLFTLSAAALEPFPLRSTRSKWGEKALFNWLARFLLAKPVPTLAGSALALGLLAASPGHAAPAISVGLNQGLHIPVAGTVANVVVTNPTIADVTVVDAHNVIVIGKGYGTSEVMVTDPTGRLLMDKVVNVAAPALDSVLTVYRGPAPQTYVCVPRCFGLNQGQSSGSSAAASSAPGG